MNYNKLSDECLLSLSSEGDSVAEQALAARYIPLIKIISRPYFLLGGDQEDLIQEGTFGLLSAIRGFSPDSSTSFKKFAEVCVRNRIVSAVRSANNSRNIPLNFGVPFGEIDENCSPHLIQCSAEDSIIAQESEAELLQSINLKLTRLERSVLDLYLSGMSYDEIGKSLSKPVKSVDNAIQRIRHKLI